MRPVEMAADVYRHEPCARTFREDLEAHLINGYVVNTPEAFVMFRGVDRTAQTERIVDPWFPFAPCQQNAWLIYLASGDLRGLVKTLLTWEPRRLTHVGWERENKLRFYPIETTLRRLHP